MTAPAWPQQYPAQYPQQFPAAPQPYAQPQQFAPGYPPATPAAPAVPLAQGSIDDFYNQPSTGGGKSLSFQGKPAGTQYIGIVTRPITSGDISQQTDIQGKPQFFRDGRPKFVMKVPLQLQPSPEFPDGLAQWYVKGQARDELVRAMAEAGAPAGPPEAGAILAITLTGTRPSGPGLNPANVFHVVYTRPQTGETSSPAPQAPPEAQPTQQPTTPPVMPYAAGLAQPQPAAAAPAQPVPPADLSPEQQALLARLTGAQQS